MKISFKKIISKITNKKGKEENKQINNNYEERIANELSFYKDCHNVHELPEIFHYWSNKFLLPKYKQFDFLHPDDFFIAYCKKYCLENNSVEDIKILSVGSGNGELEVSIASALSKADISNFTIECMDINDNMLARTIDLAKKKDVGKHIKIKNSDFNKWTPDKEYQIIFANQSLHHVLELEHLFNSIYSGLESNGLFLTSDMIGRNGHMRWPEALDALKPFWDELSPKYKYNQLLKRQEDVYINHDCSTDGFEGIRAQDILKLLVEKFNFKLFIPFANIIMALIDRPFGHNFDINDPKDLDLINRVHKKDEELMMNGILKPTQMIAVMTKTEIDKTYLLNSSLTPSFCIREID